MITTRRSLMLGVAAALAGSLPARRVSASSSRAPRYIVQILLAGGIDPVFTTDPKERAEVNPRVDIPYPAKAIFSSGGMRFGPHFAPLARWTSRMAIVNGVRVDTAGHATGMEQFARLRTGVAATTPSFLEIAGSRRDGQPLSHVVMPTVPCAVPGKMPSEVFDALLGDADDDSARMARALRRQAERLPNRAEGAATARNLRDCASLFERAKTLSRFERVPWESLKAPGTETLGDELQRTTWLLENDLTCGVLVSTPMRWDTHTTNTTGQAATSGAFLPVISAFLDQLATRSNRHGILLDNTLVVMGSELGRHPYMNSMDGKDHFPETPFLLIGAGIGAGGRGNVFGRTDRDMTGVRISPKTGKDINVGGHFCKLDDLGMTLLHMLGVDGTPYGYGGSILEFLVA